MPKIVIVTGGFDPVHAGHIEYISAAGALGDKLIIGLNSDDWLTRKKGAPFMNWLDRFMIMQALKYVDRVVAFDDADGSAIECIKDVMTLYPGDEYIFANGGDRGDKNTPELEWATLNKIPNLTFKFGVGGVNKINSSRWILDKWAANVKQKQVSTG